MTKSPELHLLEVGREGLPAQVAASIRREIVRGRLTPGDKLPTEQQLATLLGVSRNVVREGIAELRNAGLVISRQGVGAFVAAPELSPTLRLDPSELRAPEDYRSLFDLRLILETGAAELAAKHRTDKDLDEIERCYNGMLNAGIWSEDGLDHDIAFHRAVAEAAHNGFLLLFIAFVSNHLKSSIRLTRERSQETELQSVTVAEHVDILAALREGDPDAARNAMRRHLENAANRIGL